MSIIEDYWSKWLAGETTDKEVDAYIRSSFAHLVSEYRSVYFEKCACKKNSSTAHIDTNEAADVKEQNQNQEHVQSQSQGADITQESLTGSQSESTQQSGTGDAIAVEKQNQNQKQKLEQHQSAVDAQGSLTGPQSESTQQSDAGATMTVEEQNQDQEQAKGADADAPESPKIDPILSACACLRSPELRALLEGFDKGDFDEGKKIFHGKTVPYWKNQ